MTYIGSSLEQCEAWTTPEELCCDTAKYSETEIEAAIEIASQLLFRRTGYEYPGVCETTVRPCEQCACGCGSSYNCSWEKLAIHTPGGLPVLSIDAVVVDGITLDPSKYYLHGERYLTHRDRSWATWPVQDMDYPLGSVNTWSIDITYGRLIPALGRVAASDLAAEFLKNCQKAGCQIPKLSGVEFSRDGVTYVYNGVETGYFNIPTVDVFLRDYKTTPWSGIAGWETPTMIEETQPGS